MQMKLIKYNCDVFLDILICCDLFMKIPEQEKHHYQLTESESMCEYTMVFITLVDVSFQIH